MRLLFIGILAITACKSSQPAEQASAPKTNIQPYADALRIICRVPLDCQKCQAAESPERTTFAAEHILSSVSNPEAGKFFQAIVMADPDETGTRLQAEATKQGIDTCPAATDPKYFGRK